MSDFTHPRIANPEVGRDAWGLLAHEAAAALHRRRESYVTMVDNGKIDAQEAKADLAAWQAIADDWDWICTGIGTPAGPDTLDARIDALDLGIARFLAIVDRQHGKYSNEQSRSIAAIAAMRWHAERERTRPHLQSARSNAGLGHQWRLENGYSPRGQMTGGKINEERKAA